jgi:hypothetical protein
VELPGEVAEVTNQFLSLIDASAPGLVQGMYLRGSLGFGENFESQSDVDFTAVLSARPDADQVSALSAAHEAVFAAHPKPHFDGFHVVRENLARAPDLCPDVPVMFDGVFKSSTRDYDMNLVSWHELARHGVTVRGPALSERDVWTDDAALGACTGAARRAHQAACCRRCEGDLGYPRRWLASALQRRRVHECGPDRAVLLMGARQPTTRRHQAARGRALRVRLRPD